MSRDLAIRHFNITAESYKSEKHAMEIRSTHHLKKKKKGETSIYSHFQEGKENWGRYLLN